VILATWAAAILSLSPAAPPRADPPSPPGDADVTDLELGDLVSSRPLGPSPRARALAGRRVRLVGFMVDMEDPPRGGFFLAARPIRCDEEGAGTGDLPPDAVRVVLRDPPAEPFPFHPGWIEALGELEVGADVDDEGRVSFFRVVVARPEDLRALVLR
jgi:hypothetical protein